MNATTQTFTNEQQSKFRNLRAWIVVVGAFRAVRAVIVLALANDFPQPVTATFSQVAPRRASLRRNPRRVAAGNAAPIEIGPWRGKQ